MNSRNTTFPRNDDNVTGWPFTTFGKVKSSPLTCDVPVEVAVCVEVGLLG
jgi:hypothetical protein